MIQIEFVLLKFCKFSPSITFCVPSDQFVFVKSYMSASGRILFSHRGHMFQWWNGTIDPTRHTSHNLTLYKFTGTKCVYAYVGSYEVEIIFKWKAKIMIRLSNVIQYNNSHNKNTNTKKEKTLSPSLIALVYSYLIIVLWTTDKIKLNTIELGFA